MRLRVRAPSYLRLQPQLAQQFSAPVAAEPPPVSGMWREVQSTRTATEAFFDRFGSARTPHRADSRSDPGRRAVSVANSRLAFDGLADCGRRGSSRDFGELASPWPERPGLESPAVPALGWGVMRFCFQGPTGRDCESQPVGSWLSGFPLDIPGLAPMGFRVNALRASRKSANATLQPVQCVDPTDQLGKFLVVQIACVAVEFFGDDGVLHLFQPLHGRFDSFGQL